MPIPYIGDVTEYSINNDIRRIQIFTVSQQSMPTIINGGKKTFGLFPFFSFHSS